jgi:hypothetical protein
MISLQSYNKFVKWQKDSAAIKKSWQEVNNFSDFFVT